MTPGKKKRIKIPEETANRVMFFSRQTCCICREPGKPVIIHHINEDPADNKISNLALLCQNCHSNVHTKRDFAKNDGPGYVKMCKDDWLNRVEKWRDEMNNAVGYESQTVRGDSTSSEAWNGVNPEHRINDDPELLIVYIKGLVKLHEVRCSIAKTHWYSGITARLHQGNGELLSFYEAVLNELFTYYPIGHFEGSNSEQFFSELISSKFSWYYMVGEVEWQQPKGVYAPVIVAGCVIDDLSKMVVDVVDHLIHHYCIVDMISFEDWRRRWTSFLANDS